MPPKKSTFERRGRPEKPLGPSPRNIWPEKQQPPKKKKVLFVCIGNACRSQMAEAIARHMASDVIDASSAGLSPLGYIASHTVVVLTERGVSYAGQRSKALPAANPDSVDLLINMSGYDVKNHLDREDVLIEDWNVGDPFGSELDIYRNIRDEVERRVIELATRLRKSTSGKK